MDHASNNMKMVKIAKQNLKNASKWIISLIEGLWMFGPCRDYKFNKFLLVNLGTPFHSDLPTF